MAKSSNKRTSEDIQKIIEKYDGECQEYFNKICTGLKRLLAEGHDKYSKQLEFLYHLHLFQNYLLDDQEQYFKTSSTISISAFYSKAASDVLCLYECLRQGQIISSMSIERNIFESFVNLKLILDDDTINRIKLYEEFGYVQQWNRIEEYQKYLQNIKSNKNISNEEKEKEEESFKKIFDDETIRVAHENYNRVKDNYLVGRPFQWAWKIFKDQIQKGRNPSFSFICKQLGIEKMYLQFYSLNSTVVHSTPLMSQMLTQKGGITPAPNFSNPIENIAATSSMLAIDIILLVLKYAKSPKYDEIEDYLNVKWLNIF